jgi:pyocin large subunit-like protein
MRSILLTGAMAIALGLGACDAGPPAVSKAPQASAQALSSQPAAQSGGGAQVAATDPRDAPAPLATDGKPMWAANSKHTAQENADYQFNKNGKDFGAASEADYVARVHAFIDAPPAGVKRIARSNGDALLYDAKTNTFAVVTKGGAPRTMFKPRDGASYWDQQVAREQARSAKSSADDSQS